MESDVQIGEDKVNDAKNAVLVSGSSEIVVEERTEDDESEAEDVDFNPFLKESLSEPSSSLSSEVEGLDTDVVNSHSGNAVPVGTIHGPPKRPSDVINEGECGGNGEKYSDLILEQENDKVSDKETVSISGTNAVENTGEADMRMIILRNKPVIDLDDEDAICKRTRARYSLASITLDELETFLQESDDEDDIQNVDEEEEYKKFLAAVLNGGTGDDQGNLEGNDDDDDEDNDADFEIEIEEALESDNDDCIVTHNKDERSERASRRPETRQKDGKKANPPTRKKIMQQGKQLLRPLVPVRPIVSGASVPCLGPRSLALETSSQFPSFMQNSSTNGFQDHQIGQLYFLIYEHVQLLVQVYSLCVLETSRQHIASQIKDLLLELLQKRDLVLAWRNRSYPTSCFLPSYICPSVSVENQKNIHLEDTGLSSDDGQGSQWLPAVCDSVLSVLDVAPLRLVGKYVDDVSNAIREHQRRCVETTNNYLERQPLFPLPICSAAEVDCNDSKGDGPIKVHTTPNNKVPKKTLAATLVESTKKQSVALVSPQIAELAQPFYSLFNPALFPHKPPPPAVANRVLFMDSEDVLLAMGILEYNNDWKAIQQRFLPCKSEHQIFVRAKNRCSSKAPENPIKTVRKMKTSPLTEEEKVRIQEGLKAFKLDWTSVWRTVVPYRDPSLLPRQWRIALGTQKSYKADSAKRERHRIYESNRRRSKAAAMDYSLAGLEKENESGEDCLDNDNEAYVHEAFLADWRPPSGLMPSKISASSLHLPFSRSCDVPNGEVFHGIQHSEADRGHAREVSAASEDSHTIHNKSLHPHMTSSYPLPKSSYKIFGESLFRSKKAGKPSSSNLVKLAPELPPVKLPPAVRVISQSSLRSSHVGSSADVGASGNVFEKTFQDPTTFNCSAKVKSLQEKNKMLNPDFVIAPSQMDGFIENRGLTKDRDTDMDPQMHPLLFRTMEEGLPRYPVNNSISIPTFSFFPPVQHQMNVTLLRNPCTAGPDAGSKSLSLKESAPSSSSLDFHPLLQRSKEFSANSVDAGSTGSLLNTDLELSRDQFMEDTVYDAGATAAQMADATRPTSPNVDASDLDLDIHLSSAAKRRKETSHEGLEINPTVPLASETRIFESVKERSGMHCKLSQLADLAARGHIEISGQVESAAVSHKLNGTDRACADDNVGNHPVLDIVMEQEELSDSDEEMEDVEFEREEMEDSDGEEGSDSEQIVNMHKKDQSDTAMGTNSHIQPSKSFVASVSEGNQPQRRGRTPRLGLAGPEKGQTKGSWLSLNSHGSHCKPLSRMKKTGNSGLGGPVLSPPNRPRKKANLSSKAVSLSEQKNDISQQEPFSSPSRKPRNHSLKSSSSTVRVDDVPAGDSSCTEKDGKT